MRVPDSNIDQLRTDGYTVVENFVSGDELAEAQEGLWVHFPKPDEYFANPDAHPRFSQSQFSGLDVGPFKTWGLNYLTIHPDLIDMAERFLGSEDVHLYKTELWAKYSGAHYYGQGLHRDFGNHSIVVPKRSEGSQQMTSFLLLSDVTEDDGPTKAVPFKVGERFPYWPAHLRKDDISRDEEIAITGPAGTLFTYRTDIFHRGSTMKGDAASRFVLLADYQVWGNRWTGKLAWPDRTREGFTEWIERATVRQRKVLGFPDPGDPYWDEQTLTDVQARYPKMDITPYREAALNS